MLRHATLAFDAVRSHKLRSSLTALGIFIGVFTVIVMIGLIEGVNRTVEGVVNEELGTDTFWVGKVWGPAHSDEERRRLWRERRDLTYEDVDALRQCDMVRATAPYLGIYKPVYYGNEKSRQVEIIGTTQTYLEVINLDVSEGRLWTDFEAERGRPVVILGRTVIHKLFPEGSYLGREVRIENHRFTVIGVLRERGKKLGNDLDAKALVPAQALLKHYGRGQEHWIVVKAMSPLTIEETKDQVIQVMRSRRGVRADQENDFDVVMSDRFTQMFRDATGAIAAGLTGIASIALLVGGIGIMNIMLVSVTERTREIGIRKAVGARKAEILQQFIVEAVVLTSMGGLVALLISTGVVSLIGKLTPVPASVPSYAPALGLGICSFVGLVFGIFPALKAARLDPVECLRYE
ncbi:MAG TPA: ABC transporter permease [Candidatus Krumholzibacteria bacterium]|nr:ABC transporter permease [Candidatus Krumholzibacteria bacterium]